MSRCWDFSTQESAALHESAMRIVALKLGRTSPRNRKQISVSKPLPGLTEFQGVDTGTDIGFKSPASNIEHACTQAHLSPAETSESLKLLKNYYPFNKSTLLIFLFLMKKKNKRKLVFFFLKLLDVSSVSARAGNDRATLWTYTFCSVEATTAGPTRFPWSYP